MTDETPLFDVGAFTVPPAPPAPDPLKGLSAGVRLTLRNNNALANGCHPATGRALAGNGETCATCIHHLTIPWHNRTWHKCDIHRLGVTHGPATDIRVGWPACTCWEPAS